MCKHSSERQIALSKYRVNGYHSLTTPLAPNAVSPSSSTHETKVLNKVHQCVLFTKAKHRCHNLTHTLQAHTHTLTDSPTHSHTRTHAHVERGMHYLVRRKKRVSYLCNHVAYSAWWHFSAAWVPLPLPLPVHVPLPVSVRVYVPRCVRVWDKLFKQQLRFLKSTLLCGGAGDSICGKQTSAKLLQPQPTCTDVHRHACSHIRECISICSGTFCCSMCVCACVWHTFQTHKNIAAHFSTLFTPTVAWEGGEVVKGGWVKGSEKLNEKEQG